MRKLICKHHLLLVLFVIGVLTTTLVAQSLERIIRHSDVVVHAQVSDITMTLDNYNAPLQIVTIMISEVIVGEITGTVSRRWPRRWADAVISS